MIQRFVFAILLPSGLLTMLLCCSPTRRTAATASIVIRNVNVINVNNGQVLPMQDVVIKSDTIFFVGSGFNGKTPSGSEIDGSGKYMIPGLWDMHVHMAWNPNIDSIVFPALLSHGITGIRDMGGDLGILRRFRQRGSNRFAYLPHIYGAGPMIDGDPPVHNEFSVPLNAKTNTTGVLDSLQRNGSDFFKTYSLLQEDQLRQISEWSKANDMSFSGHLSEYIEPELSISLGLSSVEHLNRLDDIWWSTPARINTIASQMKRSGTYLCPTLITYHLKTRIFDSTVEKKNENIFIPGSLMLEWKALWQARAKRMQNRPIDSVEQRYGSQKKLVRYLHSNGISILAGSDFAGMPYVYPGSSLHDELALLVEAGLSNLSALQSATINAAVFMKKETSFGSIEPGKQADLLLLESNPLDNIKNTRRITHVIIGGKLHVR